jgi:uncharacterized protein (DUF58 family)
MTHRGRVVLVLAVVTYVSAWAFGSRPLYPVALGLLFASAVSWAWVRLAAKPVRLRRAVANRDYFEGDDVPVELELELTSAVLPASATVVDRIGKLGERRATAGRAGRRLWVRYVLEALPRGRYVFERTELEIGDAFGLDRATILLPEPRAVLVYPHLVQVDRLFTEAGAHAHDGRRVLLRRPSGFDLHSVREYEHGESLRRVHWRSTARRGQLMVKELEDAPRDEVAVLLDAERAVLSPEGFDVLVRAAGSILHAHVRRGRRVALVVNDETHATQRIRSDGGDWRRALEVLAAVEQTGTRGAVTLLGAEGTAASRALELVVVTARLAPELVQRLVQRAVSHHAVSVVWIDAASFNGGGPQREPALLRLQAGGVPVAVVRRGDDLAARLAAQEIVEAAGA